MYVFIINYLFLNWPVIDCETKIRINVFFKSMYFFIVCKSIRKSEDKNIFLKQYSKKTIMHLQISDTLKFKKLIKIYLQKGILL